MSKRLTQFEQLLLEHYQEDTFPEIVRESLITFIFTATPLYDYEGRRVFFAFSEYNDKHNLVTISFRPQDGDMIDLERLEDTLEEACINGECSNFNLDELEKGKILIHPDLSLLIYSDYASFYRNHKDCVFSLLEECVNGIVETVCC